MIGEGALAPAERITERARPARRVSRLNALFINDTARDGGPGHTLLATLKFLDPERVRRSVLLPRDGVVSRRISEAGAAESLIIQPDFVENIFQPLSRAMKRDDLEAPFWRKSIRMSGNVARARRFLKTLRARVRAEGYDVVFCNGTAANFAGGYLAWSLGVPVVWHGLYTAIPAFQRPLHRWLADRPAVRSILCVSGVTTLQFGHVSGKVRIIHDGIDLDAFDPKGVAPLLRRELNWSSDTVVFGSCGRILPRKGFAEMIEVAQRTLDRLPPNERRRSRFVVIGDTPRDVRGDHLAECRQRVQQLGLSDHVHFIGFRADIRPYAVDFDVAIVPSLYEDPLPRAVMESMALTKPVIAFDRGGIGEMIDDGIEGQLVCGAPPDLDGMARACVEYFRNPELRNSHGSAARAKVERSFDARAHAEVIERELRRAAAFGWRR